MLSLYVKIQNLLKREEGQGMVEYSLIIGLVVIAVIGLVALLGSQLSDIFESITGSLTNAGYTGTP
ncbi:MAG: Flp family type IVb pilin [Bacillota bacterium]